MDPLLAVPVTSPNARVEPGASGAGILLVLTEPAGKGPAGRFLTRLGLRREKRFELDALGACYWSAIDGVRSLSQIQSELAEKHALEPGLARRAVVEFTATLMRRGLIGLEPGRER